MSKAQHHLSDNTVCGQCHINAAKLTLNRMHQQSTESSIVLASPSICTLAFGHLAAIMLCTWTQISLECEVWKQESWGVFCFYGKHKGGFNLYSISQTHFSYRVP